MRDHPESQQVKLGQYGSFYVTAPTLTNEQQQLLKQDWLTHLEINKGVALPTELVAAIYQRMNELKHHHWQSTRPTQRAESTDSFEALVAELQEDLQS